MFFKEEDIRIDLFYLGPGKGSSSRIRYDKLGFERAIDMLKAKAEKGSGHNSDDCVTSV